VTHAVSPPLCHSEDFHRGKERVSLAAAVSSSSRAVELARELYLAGLGDFLSVLEAQGSQFAAEEALQNSETALRQHLVALYKAAGGGWEAI